MAEDKQKVIPVKVALRVRPLIQRENDEGCQSCMRIVPGEPQVILGQDRPFTYDYVFGPTDPQSEIYDRISNELIQNVFRGLNATILAYGQTGSGKTFTMGGCYESSLSGDEVDMGIIPRVLRDIFKGMEERPDTEFCIRVSYMEVYNEEVLDLLCSPSQRDPLSIKEELNGSIKIPGLKEIQVSEYKETMGLLSSGSIGRTTGATAMNSTSSRSHAIFTLHMDQKRKNDENDVCTMKFQLVDLAGSERVKRTGAEGDRFREGVNINKGLLVLGNVISALGKKQGHIPYRDAKLTRILQDSLGGNSYTVMIACVSPADTNVEETLNTLRYADRARKIKNKPIINRDPQAAEIMRLKLLVQQLQCQLMGGVSSSIDSDPSTSNGIAKLDVTEEEVNQLKDEVQRVKSENLRLANELHESLQQRTRMMDNMFSMESQIEKWKSVDIDFLSESLTNESNPKLKAELEKLTESMKEIEEVSMQEDEAEREDHEDVEDFHNDKTNHTFMNSNDQAKAQEHLIRQADLHRQLTEVTTMLKEKQNLAEKMNYADEEMEVMKTRYNKLMEEWQTKVSEKQREIDDLKNVHHSKNNVTKISEQRRQRLQHLEGEIQVLKKKMNEQNKIVKLKQKSDTQVVKMNTEIQAMKQQRVRLMKQMKEETASFQKWKKEKEKEVNKLKMKDSKREVQMKKLQGEFDKQQNVLKRKNAEAIAANKRLKDALSKRREIEAEKTSKFEKYDSTSIGNRVRKWLGHELDLKFSMTECKFHLDELMENRKSLTQSLQLLSKELEEGPLMEKFSWLGDAGDPDEISMQEQEIKKQMKTIQMDIDMINMQIGELQQKIVETEEDLKGRSTWQSLHTMAEAKCALKFLLEQAVGAKSEHVKASSELKCVIDHGKEEQGEKEKTVTGLEASIKDLKSSISQIKNKHDRELDKVRSEYEEKVLFLLNADQSHKGTPKGTPKSTKHLDAISREKMKILESQVKNVEEIKSRLEEAESRLQSKEEECESLKRNMTCGMFKNQKFNLLPDVSSNSSPFLNPTPKKLYAQSSEDMCSLDGTFTVENDEQSPLLPSPPPLMPCPQTVTIDKPKTKSRFTRSTSRTTIDENEILKTVNTSDNTSGDISLDIENSGLMKRKSDNDADNNENSRERKKMRKRTLLSQDITFFS